MKRARTPSTAKKAARRAARGAAAAALALAPSAAAVAPSTARVAMPSPAAAARPPILRLGADNLVRGTFVQRPSARNKSPYVGDVRLADGRVAICHMPSLDMGGKLRPGVEVLMKTSVDKSGAPIGADALGKYGTPKCEFIAQLLRCVEPENADVGGVWVGAHPSIGEKVADALLRGGELTDALGGGPIKAVAREVRNVAGTDMRCDFLLTHASGAATVVEVKTVVDTDYDPVTAPQRDGCVFVGSSPYARAAIFPWGKSNQAGPDGEKVVSARAIKHVRELTALAAGTRTGDGGERYAAAVLFVVVRSDATKFRPNAEACPSFARYLGEARRAGVRVLAHRVKWSDDGDAESMGPLAVEL